MITFPVGLMNNNPNPDPHWDKVVLYLRGEGENNSTNIIDSSPNPKTIIRNGNPIISNVQSIYSPTSIFFNGTSSLQTAHHPDLTFEGDFTVEFLHLCTTNQISSQCILNLNSFQNGLLLRAAVPTAAVHFYCQNNEIGSYPNLQLDQWRHAAISRRSGTVRSFVQGEIIAIVPISGTINTGNLGLLIGNDFSGNFSNFFTGYLQRLKITKGIGRYTAPFNPETDTYMP